MADEPIAADIPPAEHARDESWRISDFAETVRQMAEARRQAEAASEAKSRFLATVSHEIRTPLSGVLGLAGILLDTELSAEQETFARAIRSTGELMLGLVDDMLDFAKIEAGRFDLHPEPTGLEALAEEVAELLAARAHGKGLDLGVHVAPDVPVEVLADAPRLRQVLLNLVGNAVKFSDAGSVLVAIEPDPAAADRIRFAVLDTGPGVVQVEQDKMFGAFVRSASTRPAPPGNGLGLGIAREIVRRMGGDIAAGNRVAGGASFSFSLALSPTKAAPREAVGLAGRRILIAGPQSLATEMLARHLTDAGAAATTADTPLHAAALAGAAAAAGEDFDALLYDRRLGPEGARLIRTAARRALPTAVLIAPGRRQSVADMRAAGFDAYLVRPVRRASLLRIAEQLVAGSASATFASDPVDRRDRPPAPRPAGTGLRVLLVEDDEINALLIRTVLQRLGHLVTEAADGDTALLRFAEAEPAFEAVVADLHIPGHDGLALAAAIRMREAGRATGRTRLVAITADGLPATREAAMAAGFDAFLEKPAAPDAIRQVLGGGVAAGAAA